MLPFSKLWKKARKQHELKVQSLFYIFCGEKGSSICCHSFFSEDGQHLHQILDRLRRCSNQNVLTRSLPQESSAPCGSHWPVILQSKQARQKKNIDLLYEDRSSFTDNTTTQCALSRNSQLIHEQRQILTKLTPLKHIYRITNISHISQRIGEE